MVELDRLPLLFRDDGAGVERIVALLVRLRLRQHVAGGGGDGLGPRHVIGQGPAVDLQDRRGLVPAPLRAVESRLRLIAGRLELRGVKLREGPVLLHALSLRDVYLEHPAADLEGEVRDGGGLDRPRVIQAVFPEALLAEPDHETRPEEQGRERADDDLLLFQRDPPSQAGVGPASGCAAGGCPAAGDCTLDAPTRRGCQEGRGRDQG